MSTVTSLGMNIISRYDRAGMLAARRDMAATGTAANKLGKALKTGLLVGTVAITAIGYEAIKSASQFQSSMKRIQTQGGQTAKSVASLSDSVLKLAPSTQQGPVELSKALLHLKLLGMDNASAMKALKTSSDLAAVGQADLEETTNALGGAWRTGIKGATNFSKAAATVNAIIGAGNMTMEDFNAALGTGILPSAKTFGLSMAQVGSALALFTDEGVPAQAAATRLRMSLSLLGAPSQAAEKWLKKIGLTGLDLANAMRSKDGIIGAIGLLKKHLDDSGLSAAKQSILLSHAFGGGRSSSAILSMLNNFDVLELKQKQVNDTIGNYGPAVVAQRKTAQAQLKILESAWQTLMIQIGNSGLLTLATKAIQGLISALSGVSNFVNHDAIPAFHTLTDVIRNIVPTQAIEGQFDRLKKSISGFVKSLGLGSIWDKLTKPPAMAKPDKIVKNRPYGTTAPKIQYGTGPTANPYGNTVPKAIITQKNYPYGTTAPKSIMRATAFPYGNVAAKITRGGNKPKAPSQGKVIADNLMSVFKNLDSGKVGALLGKILSKALSFAFKGLTDFGKLILDFVKNTDWISVGESAGKTLFPLAIGLMNGLVEGIVNPDMWKKHWLEIIISIVSLIPIGRAAGLLAKVFEKIPIVGKLITPLLKGIEGAGGKVEKGFVKLFGGVGRGIANAIKKEFPEATAAVGKFFGDIGKFFKDKWKLVTGFFEKGGGLEKFSEWMTTALIKGSKALGGLIKKWIINPILKPFAPAVRWLKDTGLKILSGFKTGITTAAKKIGTWVYNKIAVPWINIFKKATSWLKSAGGKIVTGMKNGIVSGAKSIGNWVKAKIATPWLNIFAKSISWLKSSGSKAVTGLKNGLTSGAKAIGSWAKTHIISPFTKAFSKAKTWLTTTGKNIIFGMYGGIKSGLGSAYNWVKSHLYNPIVSAIKKLFHIHSPSKVMHSLGGHVMSGFINGLLKTNIKDVVVNAFGSLPKAFKALFSEGLIHVGDFTSATIKKLGSIGGSIGNFFSGLFGGGGGGNGGAGVQRWKPYVQAVLSLLGQPLSWTDTVLRRMNQESGGNPKAINLWDSNAAMGDPSRGLMQTIGSTFNAYAGPYRSAGIYDPFANIYAGLNYALHRYGSLSALNRPGGYANGTPGAQSGWNWVGERGPELMYMRGGEKVVPNNRAMSGGGVHYHIHFDRPVIAGSQKAAEDMVVGAMRNAQRNGRIKKGTVNQ